MQYTGYDLPPGGGAAKRATIAWLTLGLVSLILAGIFSLLLVLARTPVIQGWIPFLDFFHVSLVVHVTLSVLIWLLSISAALWSLCSARENILWDRLSFIAAVFGTSIIVISPFAGAGNPQMSNYVPVLQHPLFFAGLALFAFGISSHLTRTLLSWRGIGVALNGSTALQAGVMISAIVTGIALFSIVVSWIGIPEGMSGQIYFEFLFWGGGHVIQYSYTLLMMICWIVLAHASGCRLELTPRLTLVFQIFLVLPVIVVPFLYLAHNVTSPGHRLAFTELMKYGGLSCLPLGLAVLSSLLYANRPTGEAKYLRSALWSSVALFATGGVLGFMISGLDIVIPAHYHGATVGVTIAFMGLTYYLMPRLGFAQLPATMAFWQPLLYGGGQLMHIIGLAWTGGYGVQRKTAGLAQGVDRIGEIAGMGLMGFGGLVSVIGGLLFLIVTWKSMRGGAKDR
ncbi:MAG: cbb3-type cytochrome c oxidase subunit I [Proteobacteria bacterium]|nr:cbb3-type cytochrome c oxidase subunit I [Pseudomonadota bacterium]MDA0993253.1 cbb3-type cytochrome c oxidase subunit I [Pseudomonadota bacterium]